MSYLAQALISSLTMSLVCLALAWGATGWLVRELNRRQILDHPNHRSSHSLPTPRGGGLAVMFALASAIAPWAWLMSPVPERILVPLGGALLLSALSFLDDLRSLSALLRLLAQLVIVFALLLFLFDGIPEEMPLFGPWIPGWAEMLLTGLLWVWFLDLYNFMDGIDGMAGVETASLGGAILLASLLLPASLDGVALGAAFIGAALGFLRWNWHPARIFMGDSGSVPCGLLLGWLLLEIAWAGAWCLALVPALYYLFDATFTLTRRLLNGEKIWEAHRSHFYQQAIQKGRSHAEVSRAVLLTNLALLTIAFLAEAKSRGLLPVLLPAEGDRLVALALGCLFVARLIRWMSRNVSQDVEKAEQG